MGSSIFVCLCFVAKKIYIYIVLIDATFIPAVIKTAVDNMDKGTRHNTRLNGFHDFYYH